MPEPLLDSVPFRRDLDANLDRLIETIRSAVAPDAIELDFTFHGDGRPYRRTFAKDAGFMARQGVRPPKPPDAPNGYELKSPFRLPRVLEGTLTVCRRGVPFSDEEHRRFDLIKPLVSHLLELLATIEVEGNARRCLLSAAETTAAPILIFNGSGAIVFANESADELLSQQTEEVLVVLPEGGPATPLLSYLMELVARHPKDDCAAASRRRVPLSNGRSLEVRLSLDAFDATKKIVTLHERAVQTVDDVLPRLIGLGVSDRETEVIARVLRGMRNAEIAAELCISEYTVKDHLKHVFAKLNVASRGALVEWFGRVPEGSVLNRAAAPQPSRPSALSGSR